MFVGVVSAAEHHTPPPSAVNAGATVKQRRGGGSVKIKNGEEQQKKKERSVMYNIVYTLQLGLHLEPRTSPKEVTLYKGQVIQSRDKRSGCCRFTILWGESRFLSGHELKLL